MSIQVFLCVLSQSFANFQLKKASANRHNPTTDATLAASILVNIPAGSSSICPNPPLWLGVITMFFKVLQ